MKCGTTLPFKDGITIGLTLILDREQFFLSSFIIFLFFGSVR